MCLVHHLSVGYRESHQGYGENVFGNIKIVKLHKYNDDNMKACLPLQKRLLMHPMLQCTAVCNAFD